MRIPLVAIITSLRPKEESPKSHSRTLKPYALPFTPFMTPQLLALHVERVIWQSLVRGIIPKRVSHPHGCSDIGCLRWSDEYYCLPTTRGLPKVLSPWVKARTWYATCFPMDPWSHQGPQLCPFILFITCCDIYINPLNTVLKSLQMGEKN